MHLRLIHCPLLLPLVVFGCFDDPVGSDSSGGTEVGDGDGDPTGDGDGDGDPTGDGDGDPTGDGDGDPTGDGDGDPTGDGDGDPTGDGDGDPVACANGPYPAMYTGPIMLDGGANPQGVSIGDVDDDGDLDIIGTSRDDHDIKVYLGSGTGTFQGPMATDLPMGSFPDVVLAGAISDGIVDVVIHSYNGSSMKYEFVRMRGSGNGSFYDYESLEAPGGPFALAHIDADQSLDLVSPGVGIITFPGSVGQESFSAQDSITSMTGFSGANTIAVALFDPDPLPDVAVTTFGNLYVGQGTGPGQFDFAAPLTFFGGPTGIATGDVTGDGEVDIVVTTAGGGSDGAHLFRGAGNGNFMPNQDLPAPSGPTAVAVRDIDRDGIDDIAIVGSGNITVYIAQGDGMFGPAKQIACMGQNPRQLWIGDFNGDCVGDVVTMTGNGACIMMSDPP